MSNVTLSDIEAKAIQCHRTTFGSAPVLLSRAPGRVNLIGEHVDYCGGLVMPLAIDRYTVIAGRPTGERVIRIHSSLLNETAEIPIRAQIQPGPPSWANYVRGVIQICFERGLPRVGWTATIESSVPSGAGLSSSAALEVAVAGFLEAVSGMQFPPKDKALICQEAEHRFADVPCGVMDQFASVFGEEDRLILLDCLTNTVRWIPFDSGDVRILVINTHVKHELSDGEYAVRRNQCESAAQALATRTLRNVTAESLADRSSSLDPIQLKRAHHVVTEINRTSSMASALERKDWDGVGQLLRQSHESLRTDFEVSCPELDLVADSCNQLPASSGMIGCRMTGGGFGGSCIALVRTHAIELAQQTVIRAFQASSSPQPSFLLTRPSPGASVQQLHA